MSTSSAIKTLYENFLGLKYVRQIVGKPGKHWVWVVLLLVLGTLIGQWLGRSNVGIHLRYWTYQNVLQALIPRHPYPKRTVMVLLGDDEFWNGYLARRTPLKRDYLAKLVSRIGEANPEIVALDIDLSYPAPEILSEEHPDYYQETQQLLNAVNTVSQNRTVIFGRMVRYTDSEGNYEPVRAVFDDADFSKNEKVRVGYINLAYDVRQVPVELKMEGGFSIDSFSSAIARSTNEKTVEGMHGEHLPYGTFIYPGAFTQFSAEEILNSDLESLKEKLGFRIVIIGAAWHEYGFNRGPKHDVHTSPVGDVYGAFIHANYVEALLDSRVNQAMSESTAVLIEILFSIALALSFSLEVNIWLKIAFAGVLCLLMIGTSYIAWQNMGMFFDFFIPVILLIGHAAVDEIKDRKKQPAILNA